MIFILIIIYYFYLYYLLTYTTFIFGNMCIPCELSVFNNFQFLIIISIGEFMIFVYSVNIIGGISISDWSTRDWRTVTTGYSNSFLYTYTDGKM